MLKVDNIIPLWRFVVPNIYHQSGRFFLPQHVSWLAPQVYTLKHDVTNVQCLIPGLLLAIRKVVRLKVPKHASGYAPRIFLNDLLYPVLCQTIAFLCYFGRIWYTAGRNFYKASKALS